MNIITHYYIIWYVASSSRRPEAVLGLRANKAAAVAQVALPLSETTQMFYKTLSKCEKRYILQSCVPLVFQSSLVISVKDRQEHGQDVYTAECKHFPWPSLNKKIKQKAPFRSA